jgi:hypothetical protein
MDGGSLGHESRFSGTLDSTNVDAGSSPRTTILRPGNIFLKGADGIYYDDISSGVASAGAYVLSSEAPDADWQNKILTFTIDGIEVGTVTLGAADDTIAEVVAAINAVEEIRALVKASDNGADDLLRLTLLVPGAGHHLKVTCDLADAFGASGQSAYGTDGDWTVVEDYVDMFDASGTAADQHGVTLRRCGHFDESNLIWGGANTLPADFKRVMLQRGSLFSS